VVDDGLELPIADDVVVRGCAEDGRDDLGSLQDARFGTSFFVDMQTGEVLGAGCNGCE